ncbi:uncharacterized protein METZ01_LOCUS420697, partial [marine metagenome]
VGIDALTVPPHHDELNRMNAKGVSITPWRSQLLNQWARSGLPASLSSDSHCFCQPLLHRTGLADLST